MFKVNDIKYLETRNGVAFTANLLMNDAKVGTIENDGNGGATSEYTTKDYRELISQASKNAGFDYIENYLNHLMDIAEGIPKR